MKFANKLITTISSLVVGTAIIGGAALAFTNANVDKLDILTRAVEDDKLNELKLARGDIKISAGYNHAGALIGNNVYMWGNNDYGQLGFGNTNNTYTPTLLTTLPKGNITALELGFRCSSVIINGNIYTWGSNSVYQLGFGDTVDRLVPTLLPNYSNVSQISFGRRHNGFISNSQIYTWGQNDVGQLGDNSTTNRNVPTPIALTNYSAVKLSLGDSVSAAIALVNGRTQLYTWGSNKYYQLGVNNGWVSISSPYYVSNVNNMNGNISDISVGKISIAAIIDGILYTWGFNQGGTSGTGPNATTSVTPTAILGNAISVSYSHYDYFDVGICITQSGTYTWGFNQRGEAGTGNSISVNYPTRIMGQSSYVAMGNDFGMSVQNGKLYTWGANSDGQLGIGSTDYITYAPNIRNINQASTIDLTSTNDPDNSRNDIVYNVIKNSNNIRNIVEASSNQINLPNPGYPMSNIVATGRTSSDSGRITLRIDTNFPIINDITINGFKPVNNTQTTSIFPAMEVPLNDTTFNGDFILNLINDANADTTGTNSKLAKWVLANNKINTNTFTVDFPENTRITRVDNFELGDDTSRAEVKFNITVDKYYKPSGTTLIQSISSDPAIMLNNKVHLFGLPKPISLENCTDPLTNKIAILETQIEPQISTDTFFSALTGDINGGIVINKLLLSQYLNTRFIPVDANITITRNPTPPSIPGVLEEPIDFTFTTDKYYLDGALIEAPKPPLSQDISFVIKPKISSIAVKQNIEAITSQITTGDAIKLMSSGNNIKSEASKYFNFEHFPLGTFFSLGNQIENKNVEGKLSLSINVDKYYDLSSFSYINQNQTFSNLEISGFKPAYSINDYPVGPINETVKGVSNKTEFYDKIVQNNVVDRALLSQFIDLRAIPADAVLTIIGMEYNNDNTILLTIKTDRYYGTGGVTIFQDYESTSLVKLPTVDVVLIVILVSAGLFAIFLITCIVISVKNKNKIREIL